MSVNIYRRLLKLGMSTHVFKISLYYGKKMGKYVSQLISIVDFQTWYESTQVFKIKIVNKCYDRLLKLFKSCFQNYLK